MSWLGLTPGELIRKVREEAHMSQRELAECYGCGQQNIDRIESNGQRVGFRTVARVLDLMGYDVRLVLTKKGG